MRHLNDPDLSPPLTNPFAPGTSPYRQKGNAFIGDFAYFEKCIPGGVPALLRSISDDATRTFLSQKFIASEWYDVFPNLMMQVAAARLRGMSFEEHRRHVGTYHAEALSGVYRALLRIVSNENVATWGPRISALYWDFGKMETRVAGPREITGIRRGTPKPLLQFIAWASTGFVETTLRIAGARDAMMVMDDVETEGRVAGVEICSFKLRITWS